MSDCTFQNRLSAYFDGELPDEQHVQIQSHFDTCPACSAEVEAYGRLSLALKAQATVNLPAQTMDRLRSKVRVAGKQQWWRNSAAQFDRTVRRVTAVAAAVMVAAAAALLMIPGKSADSARTNEAIVETLASDDAGMQTNLGVNEDRQLARWIVADLSVQDDAHATHGQ